MVASHESEGSMASVAPTAKIDKDISRPASPRDVACSSMEMLARSKEPSSKSFLPTAKPFFVMDWLDRIDEKDLELARQIITTPGRALLTDFGKETSTRTVSLAGASRKDFAGEPSKPSEHPPKQKFTPRSHFRKRGIAVGNGWNAKGLQKAKEGNWEDALSCWENALEIRSQVCLSLVDVANTCNNIGIALGKLNRFDTAVEHLERALEVREALAEGADNQAEIATTLHNIGNVYQQAGEFGKAEEYFVESRDMQIKVLGRDHIHVARTLAALGNVRYQANRIPEARKAYWEALTIFQHVGLPEADIEVQCVLGNVQEIDKSK